MKQVKKKYPWYFYMAMIITPAVILISLEILLRFMVHDPTITLVTLHEGNGQKYFQLNSRVGERFFTGGVAAIPEVYPQKFSYNKGANTFRVFCLGGSTMASFPYELNARVSSLLQDRLQIYFPKKKIEVINAGISAINSYSVYEFIRELVHYQPDLFILSMGHNEFYGALGVGSTQSLGQNRWLIRTYLRLQKFRTFLLLRRLVVAARSALHGKSQDRAKNRTLMEGMAREKAIRWDSEMFRRGINQFRSNLEEILAVARRHHVPILVSTLVSNLRDMAPFESGFSPRRTEAEKRKWQEYFETGWQLQRADSFATALKFYKQAADIDAEPAILHYRLAQAYEARGDTIIARSEYERARDLDLLRFRAPGLLNEIIRKTCEKYQIPLIKMEEAFARQSRHGIPGHELVSEHLHPNFDGYFLMAKTFCRAIRESGMLRPDEQSPDSMNRDDNFFRDYSAVTEFDLEIGARKIRHLTSQWPFRPGQFSARSELAPVPSMVEKLVTEYQSGKIAWNAAHFRLAEFYQNQGELQQAIREYRAVVKVVPEYDAPYTRIADILIRQKRYPDAEKTLLNGLTANDTSPFLHAKLGLVNVVQHKFSSAATQFQKALQINQRTHSLKIQELASAHYYLALSQIQQGNLNSAKQHLAEVLRYQPRHPEAGRLLQLLQKGIAVKLQF